MEAGDLAEYEPEQEFDFVEGVFEQDVRSLRSGLQELGG